ncbi:MAG: TRAP transporter fused permease subunit [Pseudomonadota bacterium]
MSAAAPALPRLIRGSDASAFDAAAAWAALGLGVFFVLIHVYVAVYSSPDALLMRSLHVTSALALVFLTRPLGRGWIRAIDLLAVAGAVGVQVWFFVELETWNIRTVFFRPVDYVASLLFVGLILEATRRVVGPILVAICAFFIAHALYANHFPGIFFGPPSSLKNLLQSVFLDSNGIFGTAVAVMANFVVLFILFGTLLNACGGGAFFTRLAFALFGHRTGGPAKAAVVSSAMMGSLSGSAIGNVLTTGVFTIPLMIRLGYRRAFAGGVEAAASNGGIIMPPVMGAVAFIMAEFVGRPYLDVVAAATIPAALYFLVIFVTVHAEARKLGLATIPRSLLPSAWSILRREGYLLLPLALIIGALLAGRSIVNVAVLVTGATFLIAVLQPRRRLTPRALLAVVEDTARATVGLSVAAAAAGIILGAIFAVGLSFQIAQAAANAAGDQLWLLLALAAIMSLIMGMGMTAVAIYLTLVATIIPILQLAGVPPMAAHFFAFWYGIISNITPPVALTAFAAAPIARAGPIPVGVEASRLGIACFLLPILFIYSPGLLLEGDALEIARAALACAAGLCAFALATVGHARGPLTGWQRGALLVAAALLMAPVWAANGAGLALAALALGLNAPTTSGAPGRAAERDESAEAPSILARIAGARIAADAEDAASAAQAAARTEAETETLVRDVVEDAPVDYAEDARGVWHWAAWAAVAGVAACCEAASAVFLQAREPLLWTLLMAVLSLVLTAAVALACRRSAPAARAARA